MCSKCGARDHFTEECTPGAFVHHQLRRLRGITCSECGMVGHRRSACPTIMRCFICKLVGHRRSECPMRQKKPEQKEADTQSESTAASATDKASWKAQCSADGWYECSFCGSTTHVWKECEERLRTVSVRANRQASVAGGRQRGPAVREACAQAFERSQKRNGKQRAATQGASKRSQSSHCQPCQPSKRQESKTPLKWRPVLMERSSQGSTDACALNEMD
eukprot:gnl/MRDRNA2_/MRDRNA2_93504_c0_seq1.p1 gnl/MRDRNA2_/MRDRNA2_93504_c0~~gnl/MRDRNA2_/MRDRNA2_93504_c0_seq1.p1  ORF type:complete len:220 (-),score=31.10 gnl/MRDRNA2_/MRDRNA2_93504_c0_seq1:189-848(-)